ncbi:MAG: winged helix-turn-helix transcriptional regulator [Solirubrobacterales bacterium]|nr:winged helix-turn-helix transcriptional regulator [Solirubrobacterales bacterium]
MVEDSEKVDRVFHALSNHTRRGMVRQLSRGECSVGDLAGPADMSFAAASKHVKVLERAGLVNRRVAGRRHLCSLRSEPLREASEWLSFYEKFWADNLDRLAATLEADIAKEQE